MKRLFISIILSIILLNGFSQGVSKLVNDDPDFLSIGNKLYSEGKYFEALPFFEKAIVHRVNKTDYLLQFKLAECYRLNRNYTLASHYYRSVIKNNASLFPNAYLWLGKVMQTQAKYDSAIIYLDRYIYARSQNDSVKIAQKSIESCKFALENNTKKAPVNLHELTISGIESPSYYGAYLLSDVLWLTAAVKVNKAQYFNMQKVDGIYDGYYIDRLYYGSLNGNDTLSDGKMVENMFYSLNNNYLPPSFNPTETKIMVSICKKELEPKCLINIADYQANTSIALENMDYPINDAENSFSTKDPHWVSFRNKDYIFFSSNRPGGYGGYDIYCGIIDSNANVTNVINLGENINSSLDEISPFFDIIKSQLFFSSNSWPGYGGYDLFYSEGTPNDGFSKVINPGLGLNSSYDDYYYYQKSFPESTISFISSNKDNTHCCDKVSIVEWKQSDAAVNFSFVDATNLLPVSNIEFVIFDKKTNLQVGQFSTGNSNQYSIRLKTQNPYNIKTFKIDFDSNSLDFTINEETIKDDIDILLTPKQQIIQTKPIETAESVVIKDPEVFSLPVIYYTFGQYNLAATEVLKLNKLINYLNNENTSLQLAIASHTDNIDSRNYNVILSQKRTETVINYLLAKGISKDRIIERWYGEEMPKAPNQLSDGSDNPKGRQLNRRTEFYEISKEESNKSGLMVDISGEIEPSPSNAPNELDAETLNVLSIKYGDKQKDGLIFKIQLGAYTQLNLNASQRERVHNSIEKEFNLAIEKENYKNFTRFMANKSLTLNEAIRLQNKIRKKYIKTAFFIPYYQEKRVNLIDVIEILGSE